jgi:hypothetical protein
MNKKVKSLHIRGKDRVYPNLKCKESLLPLLYFLRLPSSFAYISKSSSFNIIPNRHNYPYMIVSSPKEIVLDDEVEFYFNF